MLRFFKKILAILFPNHCLSCKEIIDDNALFCSICWHKLQFITDPKCRICSYPFEVELLGPSKNLPCANCLKKKPSFDNVITVFYYNEIIKKIITDFKYYDQTFIAKKLAKLMFNKLKSELDNIAFITIVPLHINKLKKRKFNQTALLAKHILKLAKPKKIPLYNDLLFRTKDTKIQARLNEKQRRSNTKNAFVLNKKYQNFVKDKVILLIDDVMTTGSTLETCAKVLKKRGAKKVIILTLARTAIGFRRKI